MTWQCSTFIADTGVVSFNRAQYFRGHLSCNIFYRYFPPSTDSRGDVVSYKQNRVHKVLPGLNLSQVN